jgi:uncharacterized membrane protein YeaQ/YmgE (transglycosylase-associated protein family)
LSTQDVDNLPKFASGVAGPTGTSTGRLSGAPTPVAARSLLIYKEFLMVGLIISLIIVGLIAGALARLIVPGKQDMSIPLTILIGIIGSFVGGFLGYLIFHKDGDEGFFQPSGIIGSVIGAVIVMFLWVRYSGRSSIRG